MTNYARGTAVHTCVACGVAFDGLERAKYCTRQCYDRSRSAAATARCQNCGKEFRYRPSNTSGKYCSKKCDIQHDQIVLKSKVCPICKTEFIPPYGANTTHWNKSKYCSLRCQGLGRYPGSNIRCATCGKEFYVSRSRLGIRKYCCAECRIVGYGRSRVGKANPNYRHGKMTGAYKKEHAVRFGKTRYNRGKRAEWKARRRLISDGFYVVRASGSKGIFDIVALRQDCIKLIQVKLNRNWLSEKEEKRIRDFVPPPNATKELWSYYSGKRNGLMPNIIVFP